MSTDDILLEYMEVLSNIFSIEKFFFLIFSIFALILLSKALNLGSRRLCQRLPGRRTMIFQMTTVSSFFLHLFGSFYIFYNFLSPPKELMLALLGSATFAVGLALKDLVSSLISGITIILDPPFQVGDRVQYKDIYGEITRIGLRAVRLQTLDFQMVTIPNSSFINEYVICGTRGKLNLNVSIKFFASLESDLKTIRTILNEVVATSRYAYLNEPIIIVVDQVWKAEVLCFEITLKAHVLDARYEKEFQTDIYTRATTAMIKDGIIFPEKNTVVQNIENDNVTLLREKSNLTPRRTA